MEPVRNRRRTYSRVQWVQLRQVGTLVVVVGGHGRLCRAACELRQAKFGHVGRTKGRCGCRFLGIR